MAKIKAGEDKAEWDRYLLELGERIRRYRAFKNITQKDLGYITGTSAPYVYQVETGKQNITLELIWRIARGLDLSLEVLFADGEIWEEPTDKSVRQLNDAVRELKEELAKLRQPEEALLEKVERIVAGSERLIEKFRAGAEPQVRFTGREDKEAT